MCNSHIEPNRTDVHFKNNSQSKQNRRLHIRTKTASSNSNQSQ